MKVRKPQTVVSSRALKIAAALFTFCYLVPLSAFAQPAPACTPVAYLFRHAEEYDPPEGIPHDINDDTLTPIGNRHALAYVDMISGIQSALNFCLVSDVYAMARKNAPNAPKFADEIGTTNPFFTGKPFANAAVLELECAANLRLGCRGFDDEMPFDVYSPTTSTNPKVIEEVGKTQTDYLLYEYLPYTTTADDLRELVKDAVLGGHSVAFFWSSQGMDAIATVLGSPIPAYANNKVPALKTDYKAPRNSVFVFTNYNPNDKSNNYNSTTPAMVSGKFETISIPNPTVLKTGQYIQCFNYAPGKGFNSKFPKTSQTAFYCKFGEDLSTYNIPITELSQLKGAICDTGKLAPYNDPANPGVYIGYGVEDGKQCY